MKQSLKFLKERITDRMSLEDMVSIFLAFGLSFASLSAFVIEQAQRHIWARIIIGLVVLAIMIAIAIGIYYFIEIIRVIGYF